MDEDNDDIIIAATCYLAVTREKNGDGTLAGINKYNK